MRQVKVNNIEVHNSSLKVRFSVSEDLDDFFGREREFVVNYNCDIANVPYSIAIIPFVSNILPIIWITGAELVLEDLDEDFYLSLENIRKGYAEIHPDVSFTGKISCQTTKNVSMGDKSLCFFSGGVDAVATLFAHMDSHPTLFTIWGADIRYNDSKSWQIVKSQVEYVANQYELNSIYGHCNFRDFINENVLSLFVRQLGAKDDWWHGFQHGLGLIGLAAPIAYQYGYASLYIASSFTIRERGVFTCASDPRIDNEVHFCGAQVYHDQFEFSRQQKLQHIVEFVNHTQIKIPLRVCWQSWSGKNCCRCEKCYRTIFGLIAEGANPNDYGFNLYEWDKKRISFEIRNCLIFPKMLHDFWTEIQNRICTNPNVSLSNDFKWIQKHDFSLNLKKTRLRRFYRFIIRHDNMVMSKLIIKFFG